MSETLYLQQAAASSPDSASILNFTASSKHTKHPAVGTLRSEIRHVGLTVEAWMGIIPLSDVTAGPFRVGNAARLEEFTSFFRGHFMIRPRVVEVVLFFASLLATLGGEASASQPPYSVLLYYDGSPALAVAHTEALAAFAEDADYLPVVETTDSLSFGDAMMDNPYTDAHDVFVAITSEDWNVDEWSSLARDVSSNFNFASVSVDPATGLLSSKMIKKFVVPESTPVPPQGPPGFFPFTQDITGLFLTNPTAHSGLPSPTSVVVSVGAVPYDGNEGGSGTTIPGFTGWLEDFKEWLDEQIERARQMITQLLDQLIAFIEGLGPDVKADFKISIEIQAPLPPKIGIEITLKDVPVNKAAVLLRKLRDQVKPN